MFALPGSLLWLFLLVYFSCGQSLDITSSDSSNKKIDDLATAINHTSFQSNEDENKNESTELETKDENKKQNSRDENKALLMSKISKTNLQFLSNSTSKLNETIKPQNFSVINNRKRVVNQKTSLSNTTEFPMMSSERRNSYLSIAERRKYYNRTRVQTKKPQPNDVEVEYQEAGSKRIISSTEALQANEVRVIKKPTEENSNREINLQKNQTNNQRSIVDFPNNETQGRVQNTRQSVIQSQYQFGQKINSRKPVTKDNQEERPKRRKEKSKSEFLIENSTNKLNKNYPTLSTKLIRVDKFHWATTVLPQADAVNENFVMRLHENETVLEKLVDQITSNNTENIHKVNTSLSSFSLEENKNQMGTLTGNFNPLPLSNANENEKKLSSKNTSQPGQEILKLNDTATEITNATKNVHENSVKNLLNQTINNHESHSKAVGNSSNISADIETTTLLETPPKSTNKVNLVTTTALPEEKRKSSNFDKPQPVILKTNAVNISREKYYAVKATPKEHSKIKTPQTNGSSGAHEDVVHTETKNEKNDTLYGPSGEEKSKKVPEYPMTIELNENNKRVLSEMFQTMTTYKPNITTTTSQQELHDTAVNGSSHENNSTTDFYKTPTQELSELTTTPVSTTANANKPTATEYLLPDDNGEEDDYKAQGTHYNTKFYISPKLNETKVIRVIDEDENDNDGDVQERSAGVAIYVLAAFGMVPLLVAFIFGAKFMIQRKHRQYDCESDAKSDLSVSENHSKKKRSSSNLKKSPSNVTTITLVNATRLPRVQHWEDSEKQGSRNWEIPRSNIKLKTILGQGNFGQVWKAEAEDMPGHEGVTRVVAVKTVKEGATEKEHVEFIKELEIMQQIGSHPNIVALLGCCTDQEPYYLIMEYVKLGKLLTYLREHRINENYYNFSNNTDDLTSRDLTVFAYCVARGMEYLASRGIIHRDLAARNVLVDHNKVCKIADFGMSRSVRDFENGQVYEERQQKGALPIRWMAPESLVYSVFTYKSDVWSFGILMWEIVTLGSTPYPNMGAREVMRKVRDGYRLERPSHCKPELYRLISYCWAHDPNKRPDFSELRHELGSLLDNPSKDGSYVDLDRFAVNNSIHVSAKTNDFRLLERNDFKTLQKLGDWENKDWPKDIKKMKMKKGNNGKGTVTLTGQGSFTVNSRILKKEFKII